ncbi:MAG: hypothetical protein RDU76_11635 [Candidatus Edwardsbacteria bacterium]|nr:hypothetical protein [Candidatus Edwardsbacteria bacterium]
MKVNLSAILLSINGEQIKQAEVVQTVGTIAVEALQIFDTRDTAISGDEKAKRWKLACRIHGQAEAEISIEEAKLIKDLVGKYYGPVIVGQVWDALEGK